MSPECMVGMRLFVGNCDETEKAWIFIIGIGYIDEYSGGVCPRSVGSVF